MLFSFTPWSVPPFVSALANGGLAVYVWRRRGVPAAGWLRGVTVCLAGWGLSYALNTCATGLGWKIFFYKLGTTFSCGLLCLVLPLVLALVGKSPAKTLAPRTLWVLAPTPVVLLALAWTNEWHGLMRGGLHLVDAGGLLLLGWQPGPAEQFTFLYAHLYYLLVVLVCLRHLVRRNQPRRVSLILVMAATLIPLAVDWLTVGPAPQFRLTTSTFFVSGFCYWYAVFRHHLLDLVPLARASLFEQLHEPVVVLDLEGRVAQTNGAARALLNLPVEAVGKPLSLLFPPSSPFHWLSVCVPGETVHSGGGRWWQVSRTAARHRLVEVGSLLVLRDVTELRDAEQQLRRSEERFRQLADKSADIVLQFDEELRCTYVNDVDRTLRGFEAQEVVGRPLFELVTAASGEEARRAQAERWALEARGERTGALRHELQMVCKDGSTLWVEVHANPLRDADGKITGFSGVARDIRDRRATERRLLEALESERETRKELGDALDTLSHECRTPVAIVRANLDLLEMQEEDRPQGLAEPLRKMDRAVERLVGLFESVRRRRGFERGLDTHEPVPLVVNEYFRELLHTATDLWGDRFVCPDGLPAHWVVRTDPHLLRTATLNLLENAVKYSPPEGAVAVRLYRDTARLTVSLANRSALPLTSDTAGLFTRYRRGANAAGTSGTGMGLFIVQSIVERLGGTVALTVEGEHDVDVRVTLPWTDNFGEDVHGDQ